MTSKGKQLVKVCRIYQWIEAHDPEFATAIRDLCLEGALSPGGRSTGVTFLYPKEKAYREEIVAKAYSEAADEAVKLIESLILPDAYLAGADFKRPAGVGSRLGVKYAVESAEGSKVKLAGAELAKADDFNPLAKRASDIAVWLVVKGRLPLTGEAYKPAAAKKAAGVRRGGADGPAAGARRQLAEAVEAEYDRCQRADRCRAHNPYLAKVVSLLNYLKAKHPEAYLAVLPLVDYNPFVSFYLLLEPFKTAGAPLLADAVLFGDGAWNGAEAYSNAVEEFKAVFRALPEQAGATGTNTQTGAAEVPWAFRDHAAVAGDVDLVRQAIVGSSNYRQAPQLVQDAYAAFVAQNAVHGMGPILPDATLAALAAAPQRKLWQDELRFTLHAALQTLHEAPYDPDAFTSVLSDLRLAWPGNDYAAEVRLANVADVRANVAPRDAVMLLMKFVSSTDFLYTPAPPEQVGEAWGDARNPNDWTVYNRNASALAALGRITGMVRAGGVSPQALQELQIYVQAHGTLPAEVLALMGGR